MTFFFTFKSASQQICVYNKNIPLKLKGTSRLVYRNKSNLICNIESVGKLLICSKDDDDSWDEDMFDLVKRIKQKQAYSNMVDEASILM